MEDKKEKFVIPHSTQLSKYTYEYNAYTTKDVIDELILTEEDKTLLNDIILNLEKDVKDMVLDGNCAMLPTLGSIRRNPIYNYIATHRKEITAFRKTFDDSKSFKIAFGCKLKEYKENYLNEKQSEYKQTNNS